VTLGLRPLIVFDSVFFRGLLNEFADPDRLRDVDAMTAFADRVPEALRPPVDRKAFPHAALLTELLRPAAAQEGLVPTESIALVLDTLPPEVAAILVPRLKEFLGPLLRRLGQDGADRPRDRALELALICNRLPSGRPVVLASPPRDGLTLPAHVAQFPPKKVLRNL
jgi:hypothetical protein